MSGAEVTSMSEWSRGTHHPGGADGLDFGDGPWCRATWLTMIEPPRAAARRRAVVDSPARRLDDGRVHPRTIRQVIRVFESGENLRAGSRSTPRSELHERRRSWTGSGMRRDHARSEATWSRDALARLAGHCPCPEMVSRPPRS